MPSPRSLRRLTVLLLLGGVLLCGGMAYLLAQRMGQAQIQATGLHRLELYTASLQREISKYAFLPGTLELQKTCWRFCPPHQTHRCLVVQTASMPTWSSSMSALARFPSM